MNPPFHGNLSRPNWACDDLSDRGQTQRAQGPAGAAPGLRARIGAAVDALASDPRKPGTRKLEGGDRMYRLRIGDYRVIYEIRDDCLIVVVIKVGHRREIYRDH